MIRPMTPVRLVHTPHTDWLGLTLYGTHRGVVEGGCAHPSPYLALPMVRHLGGHLSATSASPRVAETEVGTRDELEREGESQRRPTLIGNPPKRKASRETPGIPP